MECKLVDIDDKQKLEYQNRFNDPTGSDFALYSEPITKIENSLFLHQNIIQRIPFFMEYFKLPDTDKFTMQVKNLRMANKLAQYAYSGAFSIESSIDPNDFIDLVELTEEWFEKNPKQFYSVGPSLIKTVEFYFLRNNYKRIFGSNIQSIKILYDLFRTHPINNIFTGVCMVRWSGLDFTAVIIQYIKDHPERMTKDTLDWDIWSTYSMDLSDIYSETIIRLNAYHKLFFINSLHLDRLKELMTKYYKKETGIFTEDQLALIQSTDVFLLSNVYRELTSEKQHMIITSFVPFRVTICRFVGKFTVKEKNFRSKIIRLENIKENLEVDDTVLIYRMQNYVEAINGESTKTTKAEKGGTYKITLQHALHIVGDYNVYTHKIIN